MKLCGSLLSVLTAGLLWAIPASAETLISDSGKTQIFDYQFSHYPGDVLEYHTEVRGESYHGLIQVTQVGNGFVSGWFSDRSQRGDTGCTGNVHIRFTGNNRYTSIWDVGGSYSPYLTCPDSGSSFSLGMTAYP
ncbi:hypothetical protein [Lyngbya confervoides]|uniref:Uncharacterized protein n=1 Tax=Lyngbya confervoides BDU141951 TaxID=1574623 RepID=A0ABD4T1G7_9CYAN|nr:hypothetical protein [Lyngbya confervoides]MCM1982241.1 hypothetical protein [Lyngbya confervoides BDU141951]